MLRPELEALLQGAVDNTLTAQERETLRQLMRDDAAARDRAAELDQVNRLLSTLGPADAPPDLVAEVLARISPRPHMAAAQPTVQPFTRRSVPKRGVTVNKKIIFALAAAAVVVLAVITYTSYPPATTGTEATIGAAQRAQAPQIAAKDVGLGDTSAQAVLQSETWDAIMKDEDLRASLQDAELRKILEDAEVRNALTNEAVRRGLNDPELARTVKMLASRQTRSLTEAEASSIRSANARAALQNEAFANALRNNPNLAAFLMNARVSNALAGEAMARVLRDARFEAALRSPRFGEALASGRQTTF